MKQIFVSSVQKEFERERAAIKRMIETDPIIKPHFKAFVFEIDAPAADKGPMVGPMGSGPMGSDPIVKNGEEA